MAHAIFISENCKYTDDGTRIRSVRLPASNIDNGTLVTLSGLEANQREVWTAALAAADATDVWMLASVEVAYDECVDKKGLSNFYNGINDSDTKKVAARAVKLAKGDIFGLTVGEATPVPDTIDVGEYIKQAASGKFTAESAATGAFAKCIDKRLQTGVTYYTFEVL